MLLNFLVDFLLLLGTNRLAGFPPGVGRAAMAAALGAIYSGACLMPEFRFLGNTLWRLVSLGAMGSVAFGWNRTAVRRTVLFVLLSMALGGIALGFGRGNFSALVFSAAGVWILCRMGFGSNPGQEYVPVSIPGETGSVNVFALRDTGNTLRDPVTGESVLVLGADAAMNLTGLTMQQLRSPVETAACHMGYRLVPYHAVGQPRGMLLMKRFGNVTVGSRQRDVLVAFAPDIIGKSDGYQALVGGML